MSHIKENMGLLYFDDLSRTPERLAQMKYETCLFGQIVRLDHAVITFENAFRLNECAKDLADFGGRYVEQPGIFPTDFCEELMLFPEDLSMYFASVLLPTNLALVLAAPCKQNDQLSRFRNQRGDRAIHHIAICVEEIYQAQITWSGLGFDVMSDLFDDGILSQQFLRNQQGQIIELITRRNAERATFSCKNLGKLRRSENGS